jgi:hypothetical protein
VVAVRPFHAGLDFAAHDALTATYACHALAVNWPPPLVRWMVETFKESGDVALDPMAGRGSTLTEVLLLVGPSHNRKRKIPAHGAFFEMACAGSSVTGRWTREKSIKQAQDDRPRSLSYAQKAVGHRMRTEYVVALQKKAPGAS